MLGKIVIILLIVCNFLALFGTNLEAAQDQLNIGAAASLQDVLKEVGESWVKSSGVTAKPTYNFAGTSTLIRQIKWGAPLDIFISAAREPADEIIRIQLGIKKSLKSIASNRLVLVSSIENKLQNISLEKIVKTANVKIAMCDIAVPIGFYAQNYLRHLGLFEQFKPKFVYTDHARSILGMVANKTTTYGFVYLTDAFSDSKRVKVIKEASPKDHPPIEYLGLILTRSGKDLRNIANSYLDFLGSSQGQAIFSKHGFRGAGSQVAYQ
ncbi:MAG: molybdate ABC transporter substrate-binding protein [Oligoflexales bacterium]